MNLDRLVELTFRPHPAIRRVEERAYCIGGPGLTPHVVAQAALAPGGGAEVLPALEGGRYRLRAGGFPGALLLRAFPGGPRSAVLRLGPEGWASREAETGLTPALRLENGSPRPATLALERLSWDDQAATAAEVSALQAFRDLFSSEVLAPGRQISVGSLAVLFTDLRGSTRLYREIGDAPAFGRVMEHFQALREAVASRRGALVKTMGDAVMAVFPRPADAVRAALAAQETLGARPGGRSLRLKAGVHHGPCIAVNQNGVLDYFGSTVNVAARLVALSSGEEVIVSGAVRSDPEASVLLGGGEGPLALEPFSVEVRGFEGEPFDVFRVGRGRAAGAGP